MKRTEKRESFVEFNDEFLNNLVASVFAIRF